MLRAGGPLPKRDGDKVRRGIHQTLLEDNPELLPEPNQEQAETIAIENGLGRRPGQVWFAFHIVRGMEPYQAFIESGHRVLGVNADKPGQGVHTEEAAKTKALSWSRSKWCQELMNQFRRPLAEETELLMYEGIPVLRGAMRATYATGNPDWNTRLNALRLNAEIAYRQARLRLDAQKLEEETRHKEAMERARAEAPIDPDLKRLLEEAIKLNGGGTTQE